MTTGGVVAGGHPATVEAGAAVLRSGGNAFDAAVAAGFASCVAEPLLTGLGGGGFLLAGPSGAAPRLYDFFVDTPGLGQEGEIEPHFVPVVIEFPASTQGFNVGRGSVAVPGTLPGYLAVHRDLGRLPLPDVVAPAVALAREGVVVDDFQVGVAGLLWPILTQAAASQALHGRADGEGPRGVGERYTNPDLASFIEAVGQSPDQGLHAGPVAGQIGADMAAGDGLVTEADLANYEVLLREPLAVPFGNRTLLTNPRPAFGGELVALGLKLLAERGGLPADPVAAAVTTAEVLVALEEARSQGEVGARLTSSGGTTHVSVRDDEGNVASMTTSNGENSGYVVAGTGVMLNNMLGEDDLHPHGFHAAPPGERVSSMMAPCLVASGDQIELAIGSGGSKRIRSALVQVIAALTDGRATPAAAVAAGRLHWDGEFLQVEPGFTPEQMGALARRWPVNEWSEPNMYFGGPHLVTADGRGAGDPRRGGAHVVVPG